MKPCKPTEFDNIAVELWKDWFNELFKRNEHYVPQVLACHEGKCTPPCDNGDEYNMLR